MTVKSENLCFVVGPIGTQSTIIYNDALMRRDAILFPSAIRNHLDPKRADQDTNPGRITKAMINDLYTAKMVIVDLWPVVENRPNPNVMYELGIRHSFNLPVVCLKKTDQQLPFDIGDVRCAQWDGQWSTIKNTVDELSNFISTALEQVPQEYGSPVWDAIQQNALVKNLNPSDPSENAFKNIILKLDKIESKLLTQNNNNIEGLTLSIDDTESKRAAYNRIIEMCNIYYSGQIISYTHINLLLSALTLSGSSSINKLNSDETLINLINKYYDIIENYQPKIGSNLFKTATGKIVLCFILYDPKILKFYPLTKDEYGAIIDLIDFKERK